MSKDEPLTIEYVEVEALRPSTRNARTHSKKQIRQIAESIKAFGFTNPVLIDNERTVLAGHGRLEAAKLLKMDKVPCVQLSNMTATQKRAYILADNKLALNAGWDEEILVSELQELQKIDGDFDIELTGFSTSEIDGLITSVNAQGASNPKDDEIPVPAAGPAVSKVGDLWLLGDHRLYCGDSTNLESFDILMAGERAEMVFTDPPYNIRIDGNVSGFGKIKHREFAMAVGEMSSAEFQNFLKTIFQSLVAHTIDGSIHYICMDWRHTPEVIEASTNVYQEFKNLCVWTKDNGGMGSFYRSQHELVFVFKSGTATHNNNFGLGQHGRYRTNVWPYRGVNFRSKKRSGDSALHPTVKPVAMVADAIRDVSSRGGIVLDCFGGSGSTLIAAHKTVRRARVIELDPIYVDLIIRRWQEFANDDAIHVSTKRKYCELAREALEEVAS